MAESYIIKNGLIYTPDLRTVIGVDVQSGDFTGRVPFGAHFIDDEVFSECPYESISLPDSIEKLGNNLFSNSTALKSIKLPSYIDELPAYMLSGCTSLVKVTMPTQVLGFAEGLFNGCTSLEEIPFRAGVEDIPENFCSGCTGIKSLVVPSGVKRIESCAAAYCTNLKAVVLPATLEYLAPDAFMGCTAIQNVRIEGINPVYYVNEEDGCLYEKTEGGEDLLMIAVGSAAQNQVGFFKDNVDDEKDDFFSDEDVNEIDETFSSEVAPADEEPILTGDSEVGANSQEMAALTGNNVDDVFNDIMSDERKRNEAGSVAAVDEKEGQLLTQMIDVMSDSKPAANTGAVSDEELANLFAKNEPEEDQSEEVDSDKIDSKTSILISSVQLSKIIDCSEEDKPTASGDLFVVAEDTVRNADGVEDFSAKLQLCCKNFVHIQNFRRAILLKGLPLSNDEFMQFYYHFIGLKHVILACKAKGPSSLSDYAKQICEQSRISLDREELAAQRKQISIKNDNLIKLVIQDIYEG